VIEGVDVESIEVRARRLAVVGDTQETAWVERLIGFEQNAALRPMLLAELAARRPDGVLHLGDHVAIGSSRAHWRRLEADLAPLSGIPILPVVGNHDRLLTAGRGLAELGARYPVLAARTCYRARLAELELVALDSNLAPESRASRQQIEWLRATLAAAEADPGVRAILGFWHHPPFTNSRRVRPSPLARDVFLPAFAASRKAIALFSGHCHGYEHFRAQGLDCFVSGGGGGPLHPLETRPERRRAPDLFPGGPRRFLHFLELELGEHGLTSRVVRLVQRGSRAVFDIAATVALPYRV
jgi:3',5'-cyclic AMP phosphodiesterase CpdA